jgi:hypothetical protein
MRPNGLMLQCDPTAGSGGQVPLRCQWEARNLVRNLLKDQVTRRRFMSPAVKSRRGRPLSAIQEKVIQGALAKGNGRGIG